ncbi:MAG TPA: hypothetical protein H9684_07570 [Firmicutes bacterium]|nr:hypothetical protein [Bacillota bacterium]
MGIVVPLTGGFLLWIFWDEAVYPLKNWAAGREWQSILQGLPETGAVTFTDSANGAKYELPAAELLEAAEFSRAYPPGQSPGTPDWQIFMTDKNGKTIQIQGWTMGKGAEVFADTWFEISCPELCSAISAIKTQQEVKT